MSPDDRGGPFPLGQRRHQGTENQSAGELVTEAGEQVQHPPGPPKNPANVARPRQNPMNETINTNAEGSQLVMA